MNQLQYAVAPSSSTPGSTIQNSSPARRATMPISRLATLGLFDISRSTSSPLWCPRASLTALTSSMPIWSTASGVPTLFARASSLRSASENARRIRNPRRNDAAQDLPQRTDDGEVLPGFDADSLVNQADLETVIDVLLVINSREKIVNASRLRKVSSLCLPKNGIQACAVISSAVHDIGWSLRRWVGVRFRPNSAGTRSRARRPRWRCRVCG
jgi:hypothetical protein